MDKIRAIVLLLSILATQQVFADSKPCATIADACQAAGYVRPATLGKKFWIDCMKPVLLGKTVANVTLDPSVVKACRTNKIVEMQKELKELQSVK